MFTKLDPSQAYQQVRLDAASKTLVVINIRGFFPYYNCLPFGCISSAAGIFQRMMENLLRGIDKVVVYLDDILITGTSEDDHHSTLENVLKRLRLKRNKHRYLCVILGIAELLQQNLSTTLSPLYEFLKSSTKSLWSRRHSEASRRPKNLLTSSKLLVHFDPAKELAVLSHKFADGSEKPIGFASHTFYTAEKNYP